MHPAEHKRRFVNTKQLSAIIGIAESTLEKRRLSGDTCPYIKLGSRVLYDLDAAFEWLENHRRQSTSDNGGQK